MDMKNSGLPFSRISYARPPRTEKMSWSIRVTRAKNGRQSDTTLTLNRARRQTAGPPQWRIIDEFISPE